MSIYFLSCMFFVMLQVTFTLQDDKTILGSISFLATLFSDQIQEQLNQFKKMTPQQIEMLRQLKPEQLEMLKNLSPQQMTVLMQLSPQHISALMMLDPEVMKHLTQLDPQTVIQLSSLYGKTVNEVSRLDNIVEESNVTDPNYKNLVPETNYEGKYYQIHLYYHCRYRNIQILFFSMLSPGQNLRT